MKEIFESTGIIVHEIAGIPSDVFCIWQRNGQATLFKTISKHSETPILVSTVLSKENLLIMLSERRKEKKPKLNWKLIWPTSEQWRRTHFSIHQVQNK